jgi:hypothetical protein
MPRSKYADDEKSSSSKKSSKKKSSKASKHSRKDAEGDNPNLAELETRLNEDVDTEFFQDPRRFQTLHRVIDVLGMQMGTDDLAVQQNKTDYNIHKNSAYKELKEQQRIIEDAIEHLALMHAQDLNGSVVQVGRVARQFNDAVSQVRHLRKQVKEIQETLGAGNAPSAKEQANASAAAASAMSLRELWLKKLEAEAVLALLDKLDRIRAAPLQFDAYLKQHRIGAATIVVAQALDTMFSSDVSQVQALHKIMEQLMMRKQKAEEIVWELLMDVLFLRTGNGRAELLAFGNNRKALLDSEKGPKDVAGEAKVQAPAQAVEFFDHSNHGITNPFLSKMMRFALDYDLQVESLQNPMYLQEINSDAIVEEDFYDDDDDANITLSQPGATSRGSTYVIPQSVMEAEFELESEERRSLEEFKDRHGNGRKALNRPMYMDHVLALRTLVECLVRLRRLDDVESIVSDVIEKELASLIQREQARTFLRVEGSTTHNLQRRGRYAMLMTKAGATTDLRDFRKHMASVVSAFGNVQVRLTHLSQIIRHRIVSGGIRKYKLFCLILTSHLVFSLLNSGCRKCLLQFQRSVLCYGQCFATCQGSHGTTTENVP